ncbi:MAG: hypothetical protein WD342_17670 [Verrucomicrobiales bacterium]
MSNSFRCPRPGRLVAILFGLASVTVGQEEPEDAAPPVEPDPTVDLVSGPPLDLDISRRSLTNFLTDPVALIPYQTPSGETQDLEEVFTIGSVKGRYAVFWDPVSCRVVGALDLVNPPEEEEKAPEDNERENQETDKEHERPSPYVLSAEGAFPFAGSLGAFGNPEYFGFRMINGKPQFLYTHGSLAIEERLWLDREGKELKQLFSVRDPQNDVLLTLPETWRARAEASAGTWDDNVLSVPKEDASEFVVTYRLTNTEPDTEPDN